MVRSEVKAEALPCSPTRPHRCSILWPHCCHGYNNKLPAHTAISRSTTSGLAVSENTASREMPVASGAAGRADRDRDTAAPDGPKTRTKPAKGDWDSYLDR
ncbi:hypothetical protein EYF80_061286 [Liparis tanakae]|uniref:Uncharacterized protein n=1 Tax=Liparis tanakae TaxID=230148 RepID=A0A4Z2EII0_9TELE|nr:hypothetical protein EYF80_061286 [Liparis tanakae]